MVTYLSSVSTLAARTPGRRKLGPEQASVKCWKSSLRGGGSRAWHLGETWVRIVEESQAQRTVSRMPGNRKVDGVVLVGRMGEGPCEPSG